MRKWRITKGITDAVFLIDTYRAPILDVGGRVGVIRFADASDLEFPNTKPQPAPDDSELEGLEDFLYRVNPDEALSLEEMDGFFCALICSPELVPPEAVQTQT
jgi:hypothetical protein